MPRANRRQVLVAQPVGHAGQLVDAQQVFGCAACADPVIRAAFGPGDADEVVEPAGPPDGRWPPSHQRSGQHDRVEAGSRQVVGVSLVDQEPLVGPVRGPLPGVDAGFHLFPEEPVARRQPGWLSPSLRALCVGDGLDGLEVPASIQPAPLGWLEASFGELGGASADRECLRHGDHRWAIAPPAGSGGRGMNRIGVPIGICWRSRLPALRPRGQAGC